MKSSENILTFILSAFLLLPIYGQGTKKDILLDSLKKDVLSYKKDSIRSDKNYKASVFTLQKLNNIPQSFKFLDSAFYYSKTSGHKDNEAKCHFLYGLLHRINGEHEIALKHLDTNLAYFKNDIKNSSYALFQVTAIHNARGDFENSIKTNLKLQKTFETLKDSFALASTLNSIGVAYGNIGEIEETHKAIHHFKQAIGLFSILKKDRDLGLGYNNIGKMFIRLKEMDSARYYLNKSLTISKKINEDFAIATSYRSLGNTYKDQPDIALDYFNKARAILEKINFEDELIATYMDIADIHFKKNNIEVAKNYYNKALKLALKRQKTTLQSTSYKKLSHVFYKQKSYKDAYDNYEKHILLKDSLFNLEKIKTVETIQTKFDVAKKDQEILSKNLKLSRQNVELEKKKSQNRMIWFLAAFLAIIALSIFSIFKQRQKLKNKTIETLTTKQELTRLESLIEGEEKERLRLAQDLHDGINGDLSVIKYKITSIENAKLNQKEKTEFDNAISMLDNAIEQVRHISHNLAPPSLQNFTVIEAIHQFCNNISEANKIDIQFQNYGNFKTIPKETETVIYRIIQEAINNIIKHSKANEAIVQLTKDKKNIHLTIEDNGKGFDKKLKPNGLGLNTIASRVKYLEGELEIDSNKNGTLIDINFDTTNL